MVKDQRIRDTVHDLVKFSADDKYDKILWELVQSRPLQRLRRIKQLGFSEFVYPGATHSRFSHSLGAMQMARRMFEAFERNAIFKRDADEHEVMRAATLAAVLLHDVGHGPYSHVFEDISKHMGIATRHEAYTRDIIKSKEVADILKVGDIHDRVLRFFESDVRTSPYTAIVSSQLDADRLDFLTRDRYSTGIKVGQIDHEWLFDSLRIEDVAFGAEEHESRMTFVVESKGLRVIEEYIAAYLKLYESVYLHKTTRGIQFLVFEAMKAALNDIARLRENGIVSPVLEYFSLPPDDRLEHYLSLDDSDILVLIKQLARHDFGDASEFAKRFLKRDLFSCFEPDIANSTANMNGTRDLSKALREKNIWFHLDLCKRKGFQAYDPQGEAFLKNIMIRMPDKNPEPIGDISPVITASVRDRHRFYFRSREDRDSAERVWRDIGHR